MEPQAKTNPLYRVSITDVLVMITAVLIGIGLLINQLHTKPSNQSFVDVIENNHLKYHVPLSTPTHLSLKTMEIEILGKQVRVIHSTCSQKICQHTGWISRPGQLLVCAPNRILIQITGTSSYSDVSAEAY